MGGYTTIVGMVNGMIKELGITVPVALHLDHGSYEAAKNVSRRASPRLCSTAPNTASKRT